MVASDASAEAYHEPCWVVIEMGCMELGIVREFLALALLAKRDHVVGVFEFAADFEPVGVSEPSQA